MFSNISWANYGIFLLITLVVYYVTIGYMYYRNEIKDIFSGKSNFLRLNGTKKSITNSLNKNVEHSSNPTAQSEIELPLLVNQFIKEIKSILEWASDNQVIKPEIVYSLQQLSRKNSSVKDGPFKTYITNYILTECTNYCSVHLDEDDVKMIWAV